MPATPARVLRVADELIDQAAAVARRDGLPDDFATLARAGLILIGSGAVEKTDLGWAIEQAKLRAGWPAREERAT